MLKRFIVFVLMAMYKHYGRVVDRCRRKMNNYEPGEKDWSELFNKSLEASNRQFRILNRLCEMREDV